MFNFTRDTCLRQPLAVFQTLVNIVTFQHEVFRIISTLNHRVITHRDVTDVPTFFVRMLGKLLEFTGIEYAIQDGGSHFKLAEHAQLIIFRQAA